VTRAEMTRAERLLYHQIHPLKLLTDVTTSFASTWLLWQARWVPALVVAFAPSVLVTVLLLRRADLDRLRDSRLGRYVSTFMTRRVEALRFGGQLVMWAGAAAHVPWLVPLGFTVASPRDDDRRGGHVTLRHPDAERLSRVLIEHGVLIDFRRPDGIRIGLSPLTTGFAEVRRAMERIRELAG